MDEQKVKLFKEQQKQGLEYAMDLLKKGLYQGEEAAKLNEAYKALITMHQAIMMDLKKGETDGKEEEASKAGN